MPVLEQFRNFIRHGKSAAPVSSGTPGKSGLTAPATRDVSLDYVDVAGVHNSPASPAFAPVPVPPSATGSGAASGSPYVALAEPDQASTTALYGSDRADNRDRVGEPAGVQLVQPEPAWDHGMSRVPSSTLSSALGQDAAHRNRHRDVAEQLVERERAEKNAAGMPEYDGLTDRYVLLDKMGDGAFSNVYKAKHRQTGQLCAIKVVRKFEPNPHGSDRLNPQFRKKNKATERANILKEVQIMRGLRHDNIIRLLEFSESSDFYFLVLELARGGELFHQIAKLTYFSEDLARHVIVQVAEAIRYMHEEAGVVHRDIKPENILFEPIPIIPSKHPIARPYDEEKEDEGEFIPGVGGGGIGKVKIADFGLSKIVWESSTKTPCGTAGYTAPEIVKDQRYNKSVDMWALGCVLYTILCGFPPFYDESIQVLTEKVARGQYTFLSPWWDDISDSSKDLITHLLTVDPRERYTIDQFLAHPWIRAGSQPAKPSKVLPTGVSTQAYLQPQATRTPPLDSPLLDALRGNDAATRHARAGMGLTTPGVHQLREAFDVSYAVHRIEEEAYHRNALAAGQGARHGLMQLNEEEEEDESQNLPAAVAEVLQRAGQQSRAARAPGHNKASAAAPMASGLAAAVPTAAAPSKPKAGGFELNMNNATLLRNRGKRERKLHQTPAGKMFLAPNATSIVSPVPSPVI